MTRASRLDCKARCSGVHRGRVQAAGLLSLLVLCLSLLAGGRAALAADGYRLYAEERYAEAAEAFFREGGDPVVHAAALIRTDRLAEARRLVDDPDPRLALLRAAAAFAAAGEIGRAGSLLDAGIARWPEDADLLARRGALEMQARRPLRALAYLARVVELVPADPGAGLALVRALSVAGMPVRVHQVIETMRAAGHGIGPELMDADLDALQTFGDHRGAVAAAESYLDRGGVATAAILTRLAISLEVVGSQARAAERRQAAEILRPVQGAARPAVSLQGDGQREIAEAAIERHDWAAAAQASVRWAALRPDEPAAIDALLHPEIAARLGWGTAFAQVHRLVDRDPDDPDRRLRALQAHAGTCGSSVLALAHAHALIRSGEAGDSRVGVGRSLREAVQARLDLLGRVVELDMEQGHLRLAPPAGPAIDAAVHPVTGRLIHFAEGTDRMQAVWDGGGSHLLSLADSRGGVVRLSWRDGRLAVLRRDGRHAFAVELGSDGRPLRTEGANAVAAFNATLQVLDAWQCADIPDARRLRLGE